jgi:hypothetical protein
MIIVIMEAAGGGDGTPWNGGGDTENTHKFHENRSRSEIQDDGRVDRDTVHAPRSMTIMTSAAAESEPVIKLLDRVLYIEMTFFLILFIFILLLRLTV